jgi:hypothetical protein
MACKHILSYLLLGFTIDTHVILKVPLGGLPDRQTVSHFSCEYSRSVLEDLPKSLDKTYERTLLGIDKEKREYAQRLLRCLTVSIRPLRVEELAEVFASSGWRGSTPLHSTQIGVQKTQKKR